MVRTADVYAITTLGTLQELGFVTKNRTFSYQAYIDLLSR